MLRTFVGVVCAFLVIVSISLADEAKGKVKGWEKGKLTVTVGGKEVEYMVAKDAKVFSGGSEVTKKDRKMALENAAGKDVTITYEKKDGKDVVSKVEIK
jgi:hypothetical protein